MEELTGKGIDPNSTIARLHQRAVIASEAGEALADKVFPLNAVTLAPPAEVSELGLNNPEQTAPLAGFKPAPVPHQGVHEY